MITDQDRQDKKELLNLEKVSKNIRVQFAFGKLKTYHDLLKAVGFDESTIKSRYFVSEYKAPLTRELLNEYLSDKRIELTTQHWLRKNPPIYENNNGNGSIISSNRIESSTIQTGIDKKEKDSLVIHTERISTDDRQTTKEPDFEQSPKETCFFFWFQKKAITFMWNNLIGKE